MPSYRCSVEIEVSAPDPYSAAVQAQAILDENVEVLVWDVEEFEGPQAGTVTRVEPR